MARNPTAKQQIRKLLDDLEPTASLLRDQAIRLQEIARAAERWANTRERLEALEAEKAAARKGVAEK